MRGDKYGKILTKIPVSAIFHNIMRHIRKMFYPNFREHCMVYGVMLVSMTTNMTARSQQKHLLLCFAMKA